MNFSKMETIAKKLSDEVGEYFSQEELFQIREKSVTRIQNFFKNFYENERRRYEKIFEENIEEMLEFISDEKYHETLFTIQIAYRENGEKILKIVYQHHYYEREVKTHFEYVIFLDERGNFQEKDKIIFPYNPLEDK